MASPPPPKGRALPMKGKGRGLKSGNTRAYQGLMSNDNGMFDTGESDKENDERVDRSPVKRPRTRAAPAEKAQPAATRAALTERGLQAQNTGPKKPAPRKKPAPVQSPVDKKEGPESEGAAVGDQPQPEHPTDKKNQGKAVEADSEHIPEATPAKRPASKAAGASVEKDDSGSEPNPKKTRRADGKADSKPNAKASKKAAKVEPKQPPVPSDEDIANMPTQLHDLVVKEKNPNVLQRTVINTEYSREEIKNQVNQLRFSKGRNKATAVEKIDIADEMQALKLQGKFMSALSQLAQLQLRTIEGSAGEEDVHMSGAQDVEKTGD